MKFNIHMVNMVMALFIVVIVLSFSILRVNLLSVSAVNEKTENLINHQIVQLQKISDLQNLMSQMVINLHSYYANIDEQFYQINLAHISSAKTLFADDSDLFEKQIKDELLNNLMEFEKFSMAFHNEMLKGSVRDWDDLREHLYASQSSSNKILVLLDKIRKHIKSDVRKQGDDTLVEITTLNHYQTGFVLALFVIFTYVIFVLYGRIKDQDKLFKLAYFDQITALPNKTRFEKESSNNKNSNQNNAALLIVDLDRYKLITGRFGYLVGERYIQKISESLKAIEADKKNRVKIYQFTTTSWLIDVINFPDIENLTELANQILNISNSELSIEDDRSLSFSFSIGVAMDLHNNKSKVDLIREADAALNISIEQGGNCFNIYSEKMGKQIKQYVDIDHALRNAVINDELSLYYQPKFDSQTAEISSSEVLLRWISNGKFIGPNIFIPIAEKSGLIVEIGNWVLKQACKQWIDRQEQGLKPLPIAVNISAVQFQDPDFPEIVKQILTQTGMPASMLELEITEEAAAANPEEVIQIMNTLKESGVGLAIDDFGTGYSSLSYLKRFPLDVLKIDQSFIRDMDTSNGNASIVKLIVDLAKQLNYRIVAEGVETEEQYLQLKDWQCDYIQGYYFSKPVKSSEFTETLRNITQQTISDNDKMTAEVQS